MILKLLTLLLTIRVMNKNILKSNFLDFKRVAYFNMQLFISFNPISTTQ
ncbi:hypothetical protein CLV53_101341 [Sediminibacterium magnilacihabitans]|jgi:hypothetical protein|nr:hypothetical protein CLV53_101341 [Sediminibacterium magnilacihabitans]